MVSREVNYDLDFYIFLSTDSYNDSLLAILHAFRINFCVSSLVDSFFCGVTFGNSSMKIYRKTKQNKQKRNVPSWFNSKILKFAQNQLYLFQTGYLRLFLAQLHFNSMSMLIETKIYSCNLKSKFFFLTLRSNQKEFIWLYNMRTT